MAERNKLASIPGQPLPERQGNFLSDLWDEAKGSFARYGRRSGAQRDASLALMSQAADPNTDPLTGAGMKALGLAGLVTHPLAFFPTREEWDERLTNAGNAGRMSRSIGGFLSDLPSLIDPQMAAGGAALAAAPLVGKLGRGISDLAGDATDAELAALRSRLQAEAAQTGGSPSAVSRDQALQGLVGGDNIPAVKSAAQSPVDEYAMSHRPPMSNSGAPLHDVTGGGDYYPDDVYSGNAVQYYGTGNNAMDRQTINFVQQMRGKPNATVTIYRAVPHTATKEEQIFKLEQDMKKYQARGKVPEGAKQTGSAWYNGAWNDLQALKNMPDKMPEKVQINPGDWVTVNRAYAKDHGESSLRGGYKIIAKKVKAKDIFTNGDSIHEWGYDPK